MRLSVLLFAALLSVTAAASATDPPARLAVGSAMPALEGDLLNGREAVLPDVARGKVALLALGFSYDSRFAVEEWCGRFRDGGPRRSRGRHAVRSPHARRRSPHGTLVHRLRDAPQHST